MKAAVVLIVLLLAGRSSMTPGQRIATRWPSNAIGEAIVGMLILGLCVVLPLVVIAWLFA